MYIVKRELTLGTAYFSGYAVLEKTGVIVPDFSFSRDDAVLFEKYEDAAKASRRWGRGTVIKPINEWGYIKEED